ncbi:hypothetical protein [Peribacillus sp. SCS-155]|uniref:hypothetical protein n=1 Tax=Peribacillus sedimenti TaxID=3115297 RepID=UPI0039060793
MAWIFVLLTVVSYLFCLKYIFANIQQPVRKSADADLRKSVERERYLTVQTTR